MNAAEQKMIDISQEISRINALASAASLIISGSSPGTGAERDQIVTGLVETIERLSGQTGDIISELIG